MSADAPLKGLILAGGQSRRIGRDKAGLQFGGQAFLERAERAMSHVLKDVYVSIRPDQSADPLRSRYACIADRHAGIGPAAGILAAHEFSPDSAWLVIACDMPLLDGSALQALVAARDAGRAATIMVTADDPEIQPLCAIYEPATLAGFLDQVNEGGDSSPRAWLARLPVKRFRAPAAEVLGNVNTPAELNSLRQCGGSDADTTDRTSG